MKEKRPIGASLPALGLSNKAFVSGETKKEIKKIHDFISPPLESTLLQDTLWPEKDKLYGHGYEIVSLSSSPDGNYFASACKVRCLFYKKKGFLC